MLRSAMVGAAALGLVGVGVLGGCGREPATGGASAVSPAPSSSTAVDGLGSSLPAPVGPTVRMITITVRGGQVSGETGRVTVPVGTPVALSITNGAAPQPAETCGGAPVGAVR
ncbi:MAG: hypothetical protein M3460_31140 [Actinomycetota bacterium]|nr:hypothetical protein [Actinomycetota bacterium]